MTGDPTSEVVVVEGADALSYLDSQCTQDLAALETGGHAATLLLQPKGDLVTVALVHRVEAHRLELEVPWGTAAPTLARLQRFAIRADVAFHEGDAPSHPAMPYGLARVRAQVPGAGELARELVPHGLPEGVRARTVSFTKGCYPGQELVARMESRHATPPYVLRGVHADAPLGVGDAVGDAGLEGAVTSACLDEAASTWHALCVLHRKDAAGGAVEVRTGSGAVVAVFEEPLSTL